MGELSNKITNALQALMDLQIITAICKVSVDDAFKEGRQIETTGDQKAMVTSINLLQGDVTNCLDEVFAPGNDDALREFDERQVKLGTDIINRNLRLLKDMAKEIIDIAKKE